MCGMLSVALYILLFFAIVFLPVMLSRAIKDEEE